MIRGSRLDQTSAFIDAKNLQEYMDKDLRMVIKPIVFYVGDTVV